MTHEFNHAEQVDLKVSHLPKSGYALLEENEILMSNPHNGKDPFHDLPDALTEKDILQLRAQLREIITNGDSYAKGNDMPFDLSENHSFQKLLDETDLDEFTQLFNGKPLPRIHLQHHRRALTENQHQFYLEQMEAGSCTSEEETDSVQSMDLPFMEDALKESDIMNLREKLQHISSSSIRSNYSPEEIENYLEGDMTRERMKIFESDLELNKALNGDVELYARVDEALQEKDIMAIREKLGRLVQSEHSSSRSLMEAEAYLEGELPADQVIDFENEMFEQRDLRAEVNLLRELEWSATENDIHSLRNKLNQIARKAEAEGRKTGSFIAVPGKWNSIRRKGTYAAIFLFLVGISSMMYNFMATDPPGYESYFKNPQIIGASRSVNAVADPELFRGLEYLNNSQYSEALVSFEKILEGNTNDQTARFYTGFSNQKLNRHAGALFHFEKITGSAYSMFTQQAEWYAVLSTIRLYGVPTAIPNIDAIIDRKGYYYRDALAFKERLLRDGN